MDYYIQGSPARAEEIKAAFEKLGFDPACWAFAGAHSVYFTVPGDNKVKSLHISIGKVIMTHPDYKELELPVQPKFKVGDKIQEKHTKMYVYTVLSVDLQNQRYLVEHNYKHQLLFTSQDNFELVPKFHYDISNFKPFDKVLVRDANNDIWVASMYGNYSTDDNWFICVGNDWQQCIPYNGDTKHLLGTTDPCDEQYINW